MHLNDYYPRDDGDCELDEHWVQDHLPAVCYQYVAFIYHRACSRNYRNTQK